MMVDFSFPPGLILIIGGLFILFSKKTVRERLMLVLPLLTLLMVWLIPIGNHVNINFLDYTLLPVSSTVTGRLFATIFCLAVFTTSIYALHQASRLEIVGAFIYAGSAIGVTFCADLISLFIFWELMTFGSTLIIWSNGKANPDAFAASLRYLLVHLFGGVVLMAGIVWHTLLVGSIAFTHLGVNSTAGVLILIGFLINAGAPPFSAWIADAYPEASPSGMVFLSVFTTKTAVYVLLVAFAGTQALIYIGLYMVFYGIIYALLENDMRRILAYSIVNQVGFMVTAIGIGTEMALNGAAAHAFAHIIYKGLLLMSAGSVLLMTGHRKCTSLGGLFQTMPITAINGIIGALAISSFPFTSGFVTKSLVTASASELGLVWVWFLLMAASAGVFLHAGIKFPWFVFFQKDSGLRPAEPPKTMQIAMWMFSFACIFIGLFPQPLYSILPYSVNYQAYTVSHVVAQFQLLLFAGSAFFVLLPLMKRTLTITLDFDWFYRKLIVIVETRFAARSLQATQLLQQVMKKRFDRLMQGLHQHHGPSGILARTWPSGSMLLCVAILLSVVLLVSLLFQGS